MVSGPAHQLYIALIQIVVGGKSVNIIRLSWVNGQLLIAVSMIDVCRAVGHPISQ